MGRDILLFGATDSERVAGLLEWAKSTPGLHDFMPDAHRLQLEHWLWLNRHRMNEDGTAKIMDVGVDNARRWLGKGYFTYGEGNEDVKGDLCSIPLDDNYLDVAIVTEVLEHCYDPFTAMKEVYRCLKPGGLIFVTSPFIWPWHGTRQYKDYWRFTADGWKLLLKEFSAVRIAPCTWTLEGEQAYDALRRWECMGLRSLTVACTGYLCEGIKQ